MSSLYLEIVSAHSFCVIIFMKLKPILIYSALVLCRGSSCQKFLFFKQKFVKRRIQYFILNFFFEKQHLLTDQALVFVSTVLGPMPLLASLTLWADIKFCLDNIVISRQKQLWFQGNHQSFRVIINRDGSPAIKCIPSKRFEMQCPSLGRYSGQKLI